MYVLDTNSVYYLADTDWTTAEQLARLQERAEDGILRIGLSPLTVLELASRIVEDPCWFERVKNATAILESLRPIPLPDPEQRMREIIEDVDLARQSYEHWLQLLETIARAPDAAQLQLGFDDFGTTTRRSGNVLHIARYRATYEAHYVQDLLQVAREINPDYDEQVLKGKAAKLPRTQVDALEAFFGTAEWASVFTSMLAYRGKTCVVPKDEGKLAVILTKSKYFQKAYESLAMSVFRDGQRPNMKRKNDYNDMHQLLYVSEFTKDVLVSEDRGMLQKVGAAAGKVMSHKDFVAAEIK